MVTPTAITIQIRQLEQVLGIKLMFRSGNSIELTEAGQTVFQRSSNVFREIREMERFLGDLAKDTSGMLKISCPQTIATYVMPNLIASYKRAYPDVRIVLDQGTSSEVVKSIQEQKHDLGIIWCGADHKGLKLKPVMWEEVVLVAGPQASNLKGNEVSVSQLETIPLVLPKEGSATRDVVLSYLKKFNVKPLVSLESASVDLIKQLVVQNHGVAFLGRSAVRNELEKGELRAVPVLEGSPGIECGVAYLQRRYLSPAAWAFIRMLDKQDTVLPEPFRKSR